MAMFKRPRPGGGLHPPPLAPTVSNFKPRAQWNKSGSSIFLYVNLPGFYRDQIEIKKDERTRTIQIQGQRPLSAQTRARFNEAYRVPERCDMTKLSISFSHGLLTFEFPVVVEGDKPEKVIIKDQGQSSGTGVSESILGRKKPSVEESRNKAAPLANELEEPKTYKSVVEGKRAVPTGSSRDKSEQKVKEGEPNPSLGRKEVAKEEKVVERKKASQKLKEEEAPSTPTDGGSLKPKVSAKEEKVTERKKDADKTGEKVKEQGITRTEKVEKVVDRKGDGEIGQKLKDEGNIGLGQKKEEKHTKLVVGDEARRTDKKNSATNQAKPVLKTEERAERIARNVNGNVKNKQEEENEKMVGEKASKGEIQERVEEKKVEEAGLVKETRDIKDNPEVEEPRRVDSDDPMKEEATQGGEDREKIVERSSESEAGPLLIKHGQKNTGMEPPAVGGRAMDEEERQKYDISLVNVGAAALVIMGFGAYVFVPLVKLFY